MSAGKLTPEQAEQIRKRFSARSRELDEMADLERQLGVRDPELEALDAEIAKRLPQLSPEELRALLARSGE
jgi:hypothetical protein